MVKVALLVRLEAKPGKEQDVASFLESGLSVVQGEPATIAWFAIRLGPSTFGIFDAWRCRQTTASLSALSSESSTALIGVRD